MEIAALRRNLFKSFGFQPTIEQERLLNQMADFMLDLNPRRLFLLKGYAGTGKTTAVRSIVLSAPSVRRKTVLLAPTGRAAKVMSLYSGKSAATIHRKIYVPRVTKNGGVFFARLENKHTNTIFIVDEASMISATGGIGDNSLLDDLVEYVYSGVNCKLLLIGDEAQLPPVHSDLSPALDASYLQSKYDREITEHRLTEVVRQRLDSGVLFNATEVRKNISEELMQPPVFKEIGFPDFVRIREGFELEDALNKAYEEGVDETVVICRSNKRANLYNGQIRARIRWQDTELSAGDYLMVVKNNYFWLDGKKSQNFIANGDIAEVMAVRRIHEMYGFQFAQATIRLVDYPDLEEQDVMLLLDTLRVDGPSLDRESSMRLYEQVKEDYADLGSKHLQRQKIKENEYYQALQVKYAYAVTCHKAQGGQWKHVFVEQAYLPNGQVDLAYLRWLYTAITRATEKVYLIGFNNSYFEEE